MSDGGWLVGDALSLADLHLAQMIACLTAAPEGEALISQHPKLSSWWALMGRRKSLRETEPGLPTEGVDRP